MTKTEKDNVSHPAHYVFGKIEVIDAIEDWKLSYHCGNVVKYVARAGRKGGPEQEVEDLRKAAWYLQRRIEQLGGQPVGCTRKSSEHLKYDRIVAVWDECPSLMKADDQMSFTGAVVDIIHDRKV